MSVILYRETEGLLKRAHEAWEIRTSQPVPHTGLGDNEYRMHVVNFVFEQINTPTSELANLLAEKIEEWVQTKSSDDLREMALKFLEGPRSK